VPVPAVVQVTVPVHSPQSWPFTVSMAISRVEVCIEALDIIQKK